MAASGSGFCSTVPVLVKLTSPPNAPISFGVAWQTAFGPSWKSVGDRMMIAYSVESGFVQYWTPFQWPSGCWFLMIERAMPYGGSAQVGVLPRLQLVAGSLRYQSNGSVPPG